jgi:hypothetical protein
MATLELEHERYVFEQQPSRVAGDHETEDLTYEPGASPLDPSSSPSLTEILAREPRCNGEGVGNGVERLYIANEMHAGKSRSEN